MVNENEKELDEDLDEEEQEDVEEQEEDKVTLSKSEYEQLKKDRAESTKEAQYLHALDAVRDNVKSFVKIYESDKKIAERIAKKFGVDAKEQYNNLKNGKSTEMKQSINLESSYEFYKKKEAEEAWNKVFTELLWENGISQDTEFYKDFMQEYEDLIEGKQLNPEKVKKYFKIALSTAFETSKNAKYYEKVLESLNWAMLWWLSKSKGNTVIKPAKKEPQWLLEKYGVKK